MATAKKTPAKKAAPKKAAVAAAPVVPIDTSKPAIFGALAAVMDQVEAIGKDKQNVTQKFKYRGIDDAYNAIHPLLALNRIVTVPRVLGMISRMSVPTRNGGTLNYTMLSVEYDFICTVDGSKIVVGPIYGEGMDSADKSTAKALAVSHKYAIFQTWCIPTSDMPDGDADTHDVIMPAATLMPANPALTAPPTLVPANPVAPDIMPQPTAVDVPVTTPPATGSLMPSVAVNTPVTEKIPAPPATKKPPKVAAVHPPMEEENLADTIVIEDEQSAQVSADMLINLVEMHKGTMANLQEFWHLNQAVLKVLNQNFPSQYKRVADTFAGLKAQLQPTEG